MTVHISLLTPVIEEEGGEGYNAQIGSPPATIMYTRVLLPHLLGPIRRGSNNQENSSCHICLNTHSAMVCAAVAKTAPSCHLHKQFLKTDPSKFLYMHTVVNMAAHIQFRKTCNNLGCHILCANHKPSHKGEQPWKSQANNPKISAGIILCLDFYPLQSTSG